MPKLAPIVIQNSRIYGAEARGLCAEAGCKHYRRRGCAIMRTNVWPCIAKQLYDAHQARKEHERKLEAELWP